METHRLQRLRSARWNATSNGLVSLLLAAGVTACGSASLINPAAPDDTRPVSPTPPAPTIPVSAPSGPVTISGTVFEHKENGLAPLPGVPLLVFGSSESDTAITLRVTSDATGRYEAVGLRADRAVFVRVDPTADYLAPCPPSTYGPQNDVPLDVHVASRARVSTSGAPPTMPTSFFAVSGLITERIGNEVRPVAGASIDMFVGDLRHQADLFDGNADVHTLTAADGRYQMCAVRDDFALEVRVRKTGYRTASQQVDFSWTVDLQLVRE